MQSKAKTVAEYLSELPIDRRAALQSVRRMILDNLDKAGDGDGYEEGMSYGMIGYYVPHRVYPAGYHCNPKLPLPFAGLASQKQHMSVYLCGLYDGSDHHEWFVKAWERSGKTLDMGKCCIRFKKLDDLALDVIGEAIRRWPARKYIKFYEASIAPQKRAAAARRATSTAKRTTEGGVRSAPESSGAKSARKSAAVTKRPTVKRVRSAASKSQAGGKAARRRASGVSRAAPAARATRR
ncbi:MAG: DUF1801 domain-containing protein [Planctomycetia bacterium]|nr:MAG: DUF1801 domain-containing protein [Planctomycetia bacterium]